MTGGAGTIGSTIVDQLIDAGAAEENGAGQFRPRPTGEPDLGALTSGIVRVVEGDIRDRSLVAPDGRHRRRIPPGGHPDHPVRDRAAPCP